MGTQTWSGLDTPASFSQALDKVTTGTADEALTSEAQTFMMLPQRFPEGAQIEVLFTDDTHTGHTLIADIKGSEWPMGKTVTYKISSSSLNWTYTLDVTALADFTYTGGTQQYCVTSYRQNAQGEKEAAEWTAQYAEDGTTWTDTKPVWLTAFTASGTGGEFAQPCDATQINGHKIIFYVLMIGYLNHIVNVFVCNPDMPGPEDGITHILDRNDGIALPDGRTVHFERDIAAIGIGIVFYIRNQVHRILPDQFGLGRRTSITADVWIRDPVPGMVDERIQDIGSCHRGGIRGSVRG